MKFACAGKLAWFCLSQAAADKLGVLPEDNEGLIDHLRAIRGVIVAIFFEELTDAKVRVSMRSKDEAVDVCAICKSFGGGGHTLAAGARIKGSLEEVANLIVEKASEAIIRASV
jgi:bifunctional oligoribonuclease and PAP phosphatase NrnA